MELSHFLKKWNGKEQVRKGKAAELQQFQQAFDIYPQPVYVIDQSMKIISVNQAFIEMFQYTPSKLSDLLTSIRPFNHLYTVKKLHEQAFVADRHGSFHAGYLIANQVTDMECTLRAIHKGKETLAVACMMQDVSVLRKQAEKISKLQVNIEAAEQLVEIGSWEYDMVTDRIKISDKMRAIIGVDSKRVWTLSSLLSFVHPEDRKLFDESYYQALDEKGPVELEYRLLRSDGEVRAVRQYADVICDESGHVKYLLGILYELDESGIDRDADLDSPVFHQLDACVWAKDLKTGKILFRSRGVEALTGYPAEKLMVSGEMGWEALVLPEDLPAFRRAQEAKQGMVTQEYRIIHRDARIRWIEDKKVFTFNEQGEPIRLDGVAIDITERKRNEEQLTFLMTHDPTTGLPNRKVFDQQIDSVIASGKEFTLMKVEMADFKKVKYGMEHEAVDQLLKDVSTRLKAMIEEDDFAARFFEDRFTLIFMGVRDKGQIAKLAERLTAHLSEPYLVDNEKVYITAKIGIASYPLDGKEATTLLKRSYAALKHAKEIPEAHYLIYQAGMDVTTFKKIELKNDIRAAVKNKDFMLYYQPIVDSKNDRMVYAEALLRWNHPDWKIVSPKEFIPLAEETGLIGPLTEWSLGELCGQIREWQTQGLPLVPISFNLSPRVLLRKDWISTLTRLLFENDVDPVLLQVEISDMEMVEHEKEIQLNLEKMKQLGVRIALDHFGEGEGSLLHLSRFNVDIIKLASAFTKEYASAKSPLVVRGLSSLAKDIRVEMVAMGVEAKEELTFLQEQDVSLVQGYLYSKPVPAKDFTKMLANPQIDFYKKQYKKLKVSKGETIKTIFNEPLSAKMTITKINNKPVQVGNTAISIETMSEDGVHLSTDLRLPVNENFLIRVEIDYKNIPVTLYGNIIWQSEAEDHLIHYGLTFTRDSKANPAIPMLLTGITGSAV